MQAKIFLISPIFMHLQGNFFIIFPISGVSMSSPSYATGIKCLMNGETETAICKKKKLIPIWCKIKFYRDIKFLRTGKIF